MRKIWGCLVFIVCMWGFVCPAFSNTLPETVRIGLSYKYKEISQAPISNWKIALGFEQDGQFIQIASFAGEESYAVAVDDSYYIHVEEWFSSYTEANQSLEYYQSLGFAGHPAWTGSNAWTVYLGPYTAFQGAEAMSENIYRNNKVVSPDGNAMVLKSGDTVLAVLDSPDNPQVAPLTDGDMLRLSDRSFRGRIEFGRFNQKNITAVNVVSLEEYLYSVVPSEMPALWHKEAVKAQAVAARTYAMTQFGVHNHDGYELCDDSHCQVYKGIESEHENSSAAVDETKGILIYYDGNPINAVFFSSSGGVTEGSENVWQMGEPYLRPVQEVNETSALTWSRTYSLSDLDEILRKQGDSIGQAVDLKITAYSDAGRVNELTIVGTAGSKVLTKETIRTYFSVSSQGSLPSRMFSINGSSMPGESPSIYVWDSGSRPLSLENIYMSNGSETSLWHSGEAVSVEGSGGKDLIELSHMNQDNAITMAGGVFVISGRGWGHGVGMSQHGANGMAEMGYTFDQILKHYYTGVEVY